MTPKYTISILCHSQIEAAKRCVQSVLAHSKDFMLILTSNGCPPAFDYFTAVQKENPEIVTVVQNETNQGFIGPNRFAFSMCDTPYFVLLNDDTEVPAGWLETLEAPFNEFPKAVLSGPKNSCCSLKPNLDGYAGPIFEYLEGSCLMCKADIIRPYGLFSDDLSGIYGEDSDLSLRMRRLGYTLHQVDLPIKHIRCATTRHIPGIRQIQLKNQAAVLKRFAHYMKVRRMDYPIVVKRMIAAGDVILTTAIVEALKLENPLCPIHVQTKFPEIYRGNPHVAGAGPTVKMERSTLLVNLDMAYENRPHTNIANAYATVAGLTGPRTWSPALYPDAEDSSFARTFLNGSAPWCAIHAGPTWPGKLWPVENYRPVIEHLRGLGFKTVLVGGQRNWDGLTYGLSCDLDLRAQTTVHQLAAVMARCRLFLGVDSMPLHCATAMKIPTIGLFGATLPEIILPTMVRAYPVIADRSHPYTGIRHKVSGKTFVQCRKNPLETITPEMVIHQIDKADTHGANKP